jgi:hypothetical protein
MCATASHITARPIHRLARLSVAMRTDWPSTASLSPMRGCAPSLSFGRSVTIESGHTTCAHPHSRAHCSAASAVRWMDRIPACKESECVRAVRSRRKLGARISIGGSPKRRLPIMRSAGSCSRGASATRRPKPRLPRTTEPEGPCTAASNRRATHRTVQFPVQFPSPKAYRCRYDDDRPSDVFGAPSVRRQAQRSVVAECTATIAPFCIRSQRQSLGHRSP